MTLKLNGTNSEAAPAYAGDDADTGLQCGTNELKLVTGGTARATVDSSGNVGIGAAAPLARLEVSDDTQSDVTAGDLVVDTTELSADVIVGRLSGRSNDSTTFRVRNREDTTTLICDSSGKVGIGHATPASLLTVGGDAITTAKPTVCVFPSSGDASLTLRGGASTLSFDITGAGSNGTIIYDSNSDLLFKNGTLDSSTERMRMDSDGRLLMGVNSPISVDSSIETFRNSGENHVRCVSNSITNGQYSMFRAWGQASGGGAARQAFIGVYKHAAITDAAAFMLLEQEDGGNSYYWTDNSGKLRTSTANSNIGTSGGTIIGTQTSDLRLKNVGANVSYGLAEVKQLQPKQYALKTEPDVNKLGFIAQEVESIIPEAVFDTLEELDGHQEGDRTKLGMEYVQLIPVLVNAVKELSAEVDVLKAKVAALEGES